MSLSRRTFVSAASRRTLPTVLSRSYASYPFTKSEDPVSKAPREQEKAHVRTPYPFTKPSEPAQIPPPTRPLDRRPGPIVDNSDEISVEVRQEQTMHRDQPDYDAVADYRTSVYSPIPNRVMDGSEPSEVLPAAVLSGAPPELQARTVRICQPSKPATQSGNWHSHKWRMDWDILGKGHRWENPLMGWQSSGDDMQATHLDFNTKEDAIRFARKQGYEYFVQEPNERRIIPKAYAEQFEHAYKGLKQVRTK